VQNWVQHYNACGPQGPRDRPRPGQRKKLTPDERPQVQLRGLSNLALPGGEALDRAGVETWNRVTPEVVKSTCRTAWMERRV